MSADPLIQLISCETCGLLCRVEARDAGNFCCPRCRTRLRHRKPNSLARSAALCAAAAIFYVPANYFPVMSFELLGKTQEDTILSGAILLFDSGMWEVGLLVFVASIIIPLAKLLGLGFLLISTSQRSQWNPRSRTKFYRAIETIGRWSMIDTFMLSILVALVQLGSIATIIPGVGATCFAAVVVITMFAAASFDPRIIWDRMEGQS